MSTSQQNVTQVLQTLDVGQNLTIITEEGPIKAVVAETSPELVLEDRENGAFIDISERSYRLIAESGETIAPITSIQTV